MVEGRGQVEVAVQLFSFDGVDATLLGARRRLLSLPQSRGSTIVVFLHSLLSISYNCLPVIIFVSFTFSVNGVLPMIL